MGKDWKNFENSKSLDCLKQIVGRNMDIKGAPGESSGESEKHSREKPTLFYRVYMLS